MEPVLGFFGVVLGAAIGSAIVSFANWRLQDKQHKQARELQEKQWEQDRAVREAQWHWEARARHDDWVNAQANRKAEWDRQREDRFEQREDDRKFEREREQRDALRELQVIMPLFSRASRAMFENLQAHYRAQREGKEPEPLTAEERLRMEAYVEQFNNLRYSVIAGISRIEAEKIRKAAANFSVMDEDMALSMPESWTESSALYRGRSPIPLQVDWQRQRLRMAGKVLRGDGIHDEEVEDKVH